MIEVQLTSVSPVAFMLAKAGDLVSIRLKKPKKNEFRGNKIGAGVDSLLVFKGITKIGMIPHNLSDISQIKERHSAVISMMDQDTKQILIKIQAN